MKTKAKVLSPEGTRKLSDSNLKVESTKLTAPDLRLRRYLELDSEVKKLTKELEALKEEFKHMGSFSTSHFVCSVEERTRKQPPSLESLVEKFGPSVESLCRDVSYKTVKVTRKGG